MAEKKDEIQGFSMGETLGIGVCNVDSVPVLYVAGEGDTWRWGIWESKYGDTVEIFYQERRDEKDPWGKREALSCSFDTSIWANTKLVVSKFFELGEISDDLEFEVRVRTCEAFESCLTIRSDPDLPDTFRLVDQELEDGRYVDKGELPGCLSQEDWAKLSVAVDNFFGYLNVGHIDSEPDQEEKGPLEKFNLPDVVETAQSFLIQQTTVSKETTAKFAMAVTILADRVAKTQPPTKKENIREYILELLEDRDILFKNWDTLTWCDYMNTHLESQPLKFPYCYIGNTYLKLCLQELLNEGKISCTESEISDDSRITIVEKRHQK